MHPLMLLLLIPLGISALWGMHLRSKAYEDMGTKKEHENK